MQVIFDRAGKSALKHIQNETGSYIWWNVPNSFIRLFGSDEACGRAKERIDEYIKRALIDQKHTVIMKVPSSKFSPNCKTV